MKFETNFSPEFWKQFEQLKNIDAVAPKMLQAAAPIAVSAIKKRLEKHRDTGQLIDSVKAGKPKKGKKGGYVEAAKNWKYSEKEMTAAKIMADNGHTVYLLPRGNVIGIKNPDMLIDNQIGDIKQPISGSKTAVDNEIRDAAHQKARIVFLQIPDTDVPLKTLIDTAKRRQERSGKVEKILIYFKGVLSEIK